MPIDKDDIAELQAVLDDRYVMQKDCDNIQKEFIRICANNDKRFDLGMKDLNTLKKLAWIFASGVMGQLIIELFDFLKGM